MSNEWQIVGLTLRTAALATVLIVPPALAVAWLLAYLKSKAAMNIFAKHGFISR